MSEDNEVTSPRLIGKRLLISRRDMGWNQEELGDKSGVSRGHIAKIERGEVANPTIDVIYRLADALGISRAYLLGLSEYPLEGINEDERHAISRPQSAIYHTLSAELIDIFGRLNSDSQQILLAIADKLRDADDPVRPREEGDPEGL